MRSFPINNSFSTAGSIGFTPVTKQGSVLIKSGELLASTNINKPIQLGDSNKSHQARDSVQSYRSLPLKKRNYVHSSYLDTTSDNVLPRIDRQGSSKFKINSCQRKDYSYESFQRYQSPDKKIRSYELRQNGNYNAANKFGQPTRFTANDRNLIHRGTNRTVDTPIDSERKRVRFVNRENSENKTSIDKAYENSRRFNQLFKFT